MRLLLGGLQRHRIDDIDEANLETGRKSAQEAQPQPHDPAR